MSLRKAFAYFSIFTWLVLACGFACSTSSATEQTFKSNLGRGDETHTFRLFDETYPAWNFWGEFARPMSLTGGDNLYLFPDGSALFTKWCDICIEKILAKGTYKFAKGKVTFFWQVKVPSAEPPKVMHPMYGRIEGSDFVSGFEVILLDPENLKRAMAGTPRFEYLSRNVKYYDWKRIHDDLAGDSRAPKSK